MCSLVFSTKAAVPWVVTGPVEVDNIPDQYWEECIEADEESKASAAMRGCQVGM